MLILEMVITCHTCLINTISNLLEKIASFSDLVLDEPQKQIMGLSKAMSMSFSKIIIIIMKRASEI